MSHEPKVTRDHDKIRRWAEERNGHPAAVEETYSGGDPGLLRIDFDEPEEGLRRIGWDAFFAKFDEKNLAFLYQEKTEDGRTSRFNKFVSMD